MKYLLFISFISTIVNATSSFLAPRQEGCPEGAKVCGIHCVPDSWTCCSGSSSGCEPGFKCFLGSNDVMGCCPIGETCSGGAPDPTKIDETELTPTADPTTTIDDGPPSKTTEPDTSEDNTSNDTSKDNTSDDTSKDHTSNDTGKDKASDNDNAGATNRLDNTVSYLLVGAMVLLI